MDGFADVGVGEGNSNRTLFEKERMSVGIGWQRRAQCQSRGRMSLISYIMILNYPWDI